MGTHAQSSVAHRRRCGGCDPRPSSTLGPPGRYMRPRVCGVRVTLLPGVRWVGPGPDEHEGSGPRCGASHPTTVVFSIVRQPPTRGELSRSVHPRPDTGPDRQLPRTDPQPSGLGYICAHTSAGNTVSFWFFCLPESHAWTALLGPKVPSAPWHRHQSPSRARTEDQHQEVDSRPMTSRASAAYQSPWLTPPSPPRRFCACANCCCFPPCFTAEAPVLLTAIGNQMLVSVMRTDQDGAKDSGGRKEREPLEACTIQHYIIKLHCIFLLCSF